MKMAKNVARRWYDEVCQYDFDKPSAVPKTGHFTEIVWSGTKKFGIGFAVGKNARFPEYKCVLKFKLHLYVGVNLKYISYSVL